MGQVVKEPQAQLHKCQDARDELPKKRQQYGKTAPERPLGSNRSRARTKEQGNAQTRLQTRQVKEKCATFVRDAQL